MWLRTINTIACLFGGFIIYQIMIGLHYNQAKADDKFAIKMIGSSEGLKAHCYPDGPRHSSGGFGSQTLCDTAYKIARSYVVGISESEALENLQYRYLTEFKPQLLRAYHNLANIKKNKYLKLTENEEDALGVFIYQQGSGNVKTSKILSYVIEFKKSLQTKKHILKAGDNLLNAFLKASCTRTQICDKHGRNCKPSKFALNKGVLSRHYATAMRFFGEVNNLRQFNSIKDNKDNIKPFVASVSKHCQSLN